MNSLSWFLYLAEVVPDIGVLLFTSGTIFGLGSSFYWLMCSTQRNLYGKGQPFYFTKIIPVLIVVFTLGVLIPSEETIYLIAGSEAGVAVVTSPEGQEILNDIHQVIKHQLGQLKGGQQE
jgi:hypothetical protein